MFGSAILEVHHSSRLAQVPEEHDCATLGIVTGHSTLTSRGTNYFQCAQTDAQAALRFELSLSFL